jgi:hypothetical protein
MAVRISVNDSNMPTQVLFSVEEYLATSFDESDREGVGGEILE